MSEEPTGPSPNGEHAAGDIRPGEMRLHPVRPPVTRLSRKVLIGLGGVAAVGVSAALFFALRPPPKATAPELLDTGNHSLPDGLTRLSQAHAADAPRLGPPLPGDLGKPMLKAGVTAPGLPAASTETSEQQRIAQERDAAQTSHLFATTGGALGNPVTVPPAEATPVQPTPVVQSTADQTATQNMQDRKAAFLKDSSENAGVSPVRIEKAASPYVMQAGWVIAGALLTGINSDLPGEIVGQVTENIFDGPTGHFLLIPAGSKLLGKFSSQVSFGQRRVQIIWTRITFPNGNWIALQSLPGTDTAGSSGLEDEVDNHWGALFKAAILSTILSVGAEAGTSDSENNLAQAIRQGASQSISQTGQRIVEQNLNIQPTLTIRPGFPIRIVVDRDLILAPYTETTP